jgi:cystathionine gamma-lyase
MTRAATIAAVCPDGRGPRVRRGTATAATFGWFGLQTTTDRRERWGDAVPPGLIRLSAGREDTDDLLDDVLGAPERIRA